MRKSIILSSLLAIMFSGCSLKNPFGIGYEHSSCEQSKGNGVCGSPVDIYKNKDKILKVQNDYLKSGLKQELFFGIDHESHILVKDDREDKWQRYDGSKWQKIINERISKNNIDTTHYTNVKISSNLADIPVTNGTDLSIQYKKQGSIIQTRTNVGDMIRDTGLIQRIWVAPYVDKKDDLISAHELYVVVEKPKWIIGETTPKHVKDRMREIPTPLSVDLLKKSDKIDKHEEKIVNYYNSGQGIGLSTEAQKTIKLIDKDTQTINQYLGGK